MATFSEKKYVAAEVGKIATQMDGQRRLWTSLQMTTFRDIIAFNYQYQSDLSVPFRLESEHQAIPILFVILLYLAPHPETK